MTAGLVSWLVGTVAKAGIQLPTKFNLPGIFSFIAQLLGVTYGILREKLVELLGPTGEAMKKRGRSEPPQFNGHFSFTTP